MSSDEFKIGKKLDLLQNEIVLQLVFLCHSKNNPPAMQGEGRSLDISMSSCAKIKVGLQNHK